MKKFFFMVVGIISIPCFLAEMSSAGQNAIPVMSSTESQSRLSGLLDKSLKAYESVKNYRAVFHKQESVGGKLEPMEKIFLKFEKPWKIYMGWLNTDKKDLQVVYERGRHDNKLAIHKPGLVFGLVPVIFLDQKSPWVKKGSESYNIEDAGIGSFLYDLTKAVTKGTEEKKLKIQFLKSTENPGEGVEVTFEGSKENTGFFAYRVVTYFHATHLLPIKMDLYDWKNRPMGSYAYEDLTLNVSGEDPEFVRQINRSLYRVWKYK